MNRKVTMLLAVLLLTTAACNRGDADSTSTTTTSTLAATGAVTLAPATTTTSTTEAVDTTVADPPPELGLPEYQIISRTPGEGGDTVVILLDPTSYDLLTDLDIQNVIGDVVERFPPILEAYVVDSNEVAEAVLLADPSEEQAALLDQHYFARLEEGFRMVFVGEFSAAGDAILGS
ncbi:MAG: hypothetical protein HKN07_15625 [Acidimicrobiia bacterium]|nr:hypothetical protein [Acidimicrobiia bacterium]